MAAGRSLRHPALDALAGWRGLLLAVALVAATIGLRLALGFVEGDTPIGVMFVLPVMLAARFGGRTGGFAATAAVAVGTKLFLFRPTGSFAFASGTVALHWALIVVVSLLMTLLVEDLRRVHERIIEERNLTLARERRYRKFFDGIAEGAVMNELVRGPDGEIVDLRILAINPRGLEALGKTLEEVQGRTWSEIYGPDAPGYLARAREVMASPDRCVTFDTFMQTTGRHYLATAFALDDATYVTTGVDVTEQHRLEQQFQQAQRLESVGRLAGGVAHDFNNIITVVLSSAEALREDHQAGRPFDPGLLDEISGASERARDLTRQLLTFARRQVVNPVPLDVADVVTRSEKLLRRVLGEDVVLEVRLPGGEGATVRADPVHLEQVLFNLAVNARDAMPGGGTLSLEVFAREHGPAAAGHPEGRWVVLTVRDTGTGMTPEVQAHAFEPFFTTKEAGKGTGLGLATVHGIVLQSGGHVHLASEVGRGTELQICLPRIDERPAGAELPRPAAAAGAGTLLLVEDDPQVRAVTARALERGGYRVVSVASGSEALASFRERPQRIDLLVTDVMMPAMNGHEVALALQRERPGLPVLYVSGYSPDFLVERRAVGPGLPILQKPFTSEALLDRVREVLAGPTA